MKPVSELHCWNQSCQQELQYKRFCASAGMVGTGSREGSIWHNHTQHDLGRCRCQVQIHCLGYHHIDFFSIFWHRKRTFSTFLSSEPSSLPKPRPVWKDSLFLSSRILSFPPFSDLSPPYLWPVFLCHKDGLSSGTLLPERNKLTTMVSVLCFISYLTIKSLLVSPIFSFSAYVSLPCEAYEVTKYITVKILHWFIIFDSKA